MPRVFPRVTRLGAALSGSLVIAFAVALAGCGDGGQPAESTATVGTPAATVPVASPTAPAGTATVTIATATGPAGTVSGDPSIEIVQPADGATIASPATVEVRVEGVTLMLGPAGEFVPGGAHWHIYIDGALVPAPYATASTQLPLSTGDHAMTVALYLNSNDLQEVAVDQVEVTVSP